MPSMLQSRSLIPAAIAREMRCVLDAIGVKVSSIDYELGKLTEPALKGLAFEAERHGSFEDEPLWRGADHDSLLHDGG